MNRRDLIFTYQWTTFAGDEPNVSGYADNTILNRNEGNEVLFFIRTYLKSNGLSGVNAGQKVEFMLKQIVPKSILSQRNVKLWIEKNWEDTILKSCMLNMAHRA